MSDCNRSRNYAIGLGAILAVGLVAFSTYQYGAAAGVQSEIALQADNQAKQEHDSSHAQIEDCSQNIVAPKEQEACEAKASQESQSQQAMALWTRYMGIAAIIGITVGIIGTGLIFFTFWETRKGARAAEASRDAYIRTESARLIGGITWLGTSQFKIKFTNMGRSPAFVAICDACLMEDGQFDVPYPMSDTNHPQGYVVDRGKYYESALLEVPTTKGPIKVVSAIIFKDDIVGFQFSTATFEFDPKTGKANPTFGFNMTEWNNATKQFESDRKVQN